MKKVLFTGGGSAGHVVPNLALIEELLSEGKIDVAYIGTNGIEKELVAPWRVPFYEISPPKLVRGGGWKALKRNLSIPRTYLQAKKAALVALKRIRPDLIFSKGGYVALPVVAAAKKLRIPCLAHESDLTPGLANRLCARKCKHLFTSFPETANLLPHGKYSGAPLRRALFRTSRAAARIAFNVPHHEKVLLVFGGGSGSAPINEALRKNLKTLCSRYVVLHVCGRGNLIESNLKNYRQFEFIEDMGAAYACADLIVARAGAGTVFELLALKKPSLLIPLEGQTRGDQIENAAYFERRGLCHTLAQGRLDKLVQSVDAVDSDEGLKTRLSQTNFTNGNDVILAEIRKMVNG